MHFMATGHCVHGGVGEGGIRGWRGAIPSLFPNASKLQAPSSNHQDDFFQRDRPWCVIFLAVHATCFGQTFPNSGELTRNPHDPADFSRHALPAELVGTIIRMGIESGPLKKKRMSFLGKGLVDAVKSSLGQKQDLRISVSFFKDIKDKNTHDVFKTMYKDVLPHTKSLRITNFVTNPKQMSDIVKSKIKDVPALHLKTKVIERLFELTNLESLTIDAYKHMKTVPDGLGNLTKLKSFVLENCDNPTALPDSIGDLIDLNSLHIKDCTTTFLPESIGELVNLSNLRIEGCGILKALPASICDLVNLSSLHLHCYSMTALPYSISDLINLSSLHIECRDMTSLPNTIGKLSNLGSLYIRGCDLVDLPASIGNLSNLSSLVISDCSRLETVPDCLGNLTKLSSLDLGGCTKLETLPESIAGLAKLVQLTLGGCCPQHIGNMSCLTSLTLNSCRNLTTLPETITNLTKLKTLVIRSCYKLTTLPETISKLSQLSSLRVNEHCSNLTLPESIGDLSNLKTLALAFVRVPASIVKLTKLTYLYLDNCKLTTLTTPLETIGKLTNLNNLFLKYCFDPEPSSQQMETLISKLHKLSEASKSRLRHRQCVYSMFD